MSAPAWFRLLGLLPTADPGPSALPQGAFAAPPVVGWSEPLPAPPAPSAMRTEGGSPVLSGDRLYVGASQDNALLIINRTNGALVTRLPASGPVQSAPVLDGDRIWFSDAAGYTWCYPRAGGQALWSHFSGAPILDSPTVTEGRVYIENVDDQVYALDASTGALVWRHAQKLDLGRSSELQLFGAPSPVLAGTVVLTGHSDGTLVVLGRDDGEVIWQRRVGEGRYPDLIAPAVVLDGTAIITGYAAPMLAIDLATRNVRWRLDDVGGPTPPVLVDKTLYHGGLDGKLRAINAVTGEVGWTWDSETGGALTEPVVTEAGLLVGSAVGGLYLVDPSAGTLRWELNPDHLLDGVSARPAADGPEGVVLTNAGNLVYLVAPPPPAETPAIRALGERALP